MRQLFGGRGPCAVIAEVLDVIAGTFDPAQRGRLVLPG